MHKTLTAVLFFGLALATPSVAGPALQDENLLSPLPDGFKTAIHQSQGAMTIAEYIPQVETTAAWSSMVTVQIFHNLKLFDADQFAGGMQKQWLAACPGSEVRKAGGGAENGYNFFLWLFTCPSNPRTAKPENMFAKFISGNDAFYSVQYAYRSDLNKEIIASTMQYLKSVSVCDSRLPDRPCPTIKP